MSTQAQSIAGVMAGRVRARRYVAPPSNVPAWLSGAAVNQWVEISGSAQNLVPASMAQPHGTDGVSSRVDAWTGFVRRGTSVFCIRQGGHTDYYGNEVLDIDLNVSAPQWALRLASSASGAVVNGGWYSDGKPCAVHGYYTQQYVAQRDQFISIGSGAVVTNGGSNGDCVVYDPNTNAYLPQGSIANMPAPSQSIWACWKDDETGNLYSMFNFDVHRWNQSSNTWSAGIASSGTQYGYQATACVDTTRRVAFICGGDPGARAPVKFSLDSNTFSNANPTGSTSILNTTQFGLTFCPTTDKFYYMDGVPGGSAGLYEIDAATYAISAKTTTGGGSIPAALSVNQGNDNGVFTRFLYIPDLGGIAYWPNFTSNCWFLKLHEV